MRELLTVQDGQGQDGQSEKSAEANGVGSKAVEEDAPLEEEEVVDIRQRTATFLLGEGR